MSAETAKNNPEQPSPLNEAAIEASSETPDTQQAAQDEPKSKHTRKAERKARLERFREWKQHRPFLGGLLMVCSGLVILAPAYLSLRIKDLLVVISAISGVSTLMLGVLLIMFGVGAWTRPATAPYLGALGIIAAVVSLPTSNFGGFILGALLGIVGGSLTLAWQEGERPGGKRRKAKGEKVEPNDQAQSTSVAKGVAGCVLGFFLAGLVLTGTLPVASAQTDHKEFTGQTSVVTADEVSVIGNVQVAIVEIPTQAGVKKMIQLSGNEATVNNIGLVLPGTQGGAGQLTTGPGTIAKLKGEPVTILTRTLTATPTVEGFPTIPVTVDAEGNIDWITDQLLRLGFTHIGVPDKIMQHISLRNVHLDAYAVTGATLDAPGLTVTAN